MKVYQIAQTNAQAWQSLDKAIVASLNITLKQAYPTYTLKDYANPASVPATPANGDVYLVDAAGTCWGLTVTEKQLIARVAGAWTILTETLETLNAKISAVNAGKSVYDIAVAHGFSGTESEYNTFVNDARTAAQTARTGAETAQAAAQTAKTGAETAQTAAQTAKTGAETAQAAAVAAKDTAVAATASFDSRCFTDNNTLNNYIKEIYVSGVDSAKSYYFKMLQGSNRQFAIYESGTNTLVAFKSSISTTVTNSILSQVIPQSSSSGISATVLYDDNLMSKTPPVQGNLMLKAFNKRYSPVINGDQDTLASTVASVAANYQKLFLPASVDPISTLTSKYISNVNGTISTFSGYSIKLYSVTAGDQIVITNNVNASLASYPYGFYSSSDLSSATKIYVYPTVYGSISGKPFDFGTVTVPAGATIFAFVEYTGFTSSLNKLTETSVKVLQNISDIADLKVRPFSADLQFVKRTGDVLYIGSKFSATEDILISFQKCMFNELMTFYAVGKAANTAAYPGLPDRTMTTVLNQVSSDNIGPLSMSVGGWVGANHSYANGGTIKTAVCLSFSFLADGVEVSAGSQMFAKEVEVRVKNRIYDPARPTFDVDGITVLSLNQELCIEDVVYRVRNGNIHVTVSHTFSASGTIGTYYGMQSMFVNEGEIYTPNGEYLDFTTAPTSKQFLKSAYPNFNRFIERLSSKLGYQSSYLIPTYKLGKHESIVSSDFIFNRSSGKCYHHLIGSTAVVSGTITGWSGLYTWFTPIVDDDNMLVYAGKLKGVDHLFIDIKKAFTGYVLLPEKYVLQDFSIVEKSSTLTIGDTIDSIGLSVVASSNGSLIMKF